MPAMAALHTAALVVAAITAAASATVPTPSLRGSDFAAAEESAVKSGLRVAKLGPGAEEVVQRAEARGGAGLDADSDQTCFTGESHLSFYRNPWNNGNGDKGDRGDWVKCLPKPSFAIMCQHLYHPVRVNEQGQADRTREAGPNQGVLHDIEVGALYEQLHRVYSSTGHLFELKTSQAMDEAVNHYVLGRGQFVSSSTGDESESWKKDPSEVVQLRQQYTNGCFSNERGEGKDNRTTFRDSMYCALVQQAWRAPLETKLLVDRGGKRNCAKTCDNLGGCSEWRPTKCSTLKTKKDLKCFCRDGSEVSITEKQKSCDEECGTETGCGIAYQKVARTCKKAGRCFCKADRIVGTLELEVSGNSVVATDVVAATRLGVGTQSGSEEEEEFFEARGVANDVGGWEVCDGTDHVVLELGGSLCSDGTRALGEAGPCLVKLEGMSFGEAEPMCARKGGRLFARADLLGDEGSQVSELASRESGGQGLGVGLKFNTTLSRRKFEKRVRNGRFRKLGQFWVAGEFAPTKTLPETWNFVEGLFDSMVDVLYGKKGAPSEVCLLLGVEEEEDLMKAVNCRANVDWLCEGRSANEKNVGLSVMDDLMADEGAFCMWHLPEAEVGSMLPNGQAGGFDNTELADEVSLPVFGRSVGWEGEKADMEFLPSSASPDDTSFHCHWSPTNTGLMRMYEFQHMYERGYPGAMKDRCACGYRHMKDLLTRCDCTRSGKQNGGCQAFHENQLQKATNTKVKCNANQCDDDGKI